MLSLLLDNLISAPLLFFVLGAVSVAVRTGLEFPQPIPKLLSMFLLIAIGLQGGHKLRVEGLTEDLWPLVGLTITSSLLLPLLAYGLLKSIVGQSNAAVLGAAYGSVSAVTFITGVNYLNVHNINYSGSMVALLALMESPSIIVGLILANLGRASHVQNGWLDHLRHALLNSSVFLLLGSLLVGALMEGPRWNVLTPLYVDLFQPILTLFLLDMGIVAASHSGAMTRYGWRPFLFACIAPLCLGPLAVLLVHCCGVQQGDALLTGLLVAGASYIAVPAVMRAAVPKASPGLYVSMALGLTFPINISIGIPMLWTLIEYLWQ